MISITLTNDFRSLSCALTLCSGLVAGPGMWATAADNNTLLAESAAIAAEIENYEAQLANLESEFGPYHRSLLEPLASLTNIASDQQDYDSVAELLNRQLQVMRTVMGFRHPDIEPVLQDIIRNEIRLQDWESVSDQLDHLRYLVGGDEPLPTPALLKVIEQQISWYLTRFYLDSPERRARHFMEARDLSAELLDMAEDLYGDESVEIIPWLYGNAMMTYRLVEIMNADGSVASDTIDRLVRAEGPSRIQSARFGNARFSNQFSTGRFVPVVEEDELIGEAYLRDAWNAASKIGEIAEQQVNLEAQAMALIYEGDFMEIADRSTAVRRYREAQELLLEAGLNEEKVDQFFGQPMLIPMPQLFLTLDEALQYQAQQRNGLVVEEDTVHVGTLVAWQDDVPGVMRPSLDADYLRVELPVSRVDATFTVSASGRISSVEVINVVPEERDVEQHARRAIRELKVRPALIDGRARRSVDVHIRYEILLEP